MSIRFTETAKWDDPWFQSLKGAHKLVFLYTVDRCNNAGFYEINEPLMLLHTGLTKENVEGAWKGLARALVGADGWIWVKNFLRHQRNAELSASNTAHKQIIGLLRGQLERFGGVPGFAQFIAPYKGLLSPLCNVESKERRGAQRGGPIERFEDFWMAYPRKVAKGDALKAWKTLRCDELADVIMPAVTRCAASLDWTKEGGKFIPYPATWLNHTGWEDQLSPTGTNGNAVPMGQHGACRIV